MADENPNPTQRSALERRETVACGQFEAMWNRGNVGAADEVYDPDHVSHVSGAAEDPLDVAAFKRYVERFRAAFPDVELYVEDVISGEESVVLRWSGGGTHEGPFRGIEPTGREVELTGVVIDRFEEDRIVETWVQFDTLDLLEQLGADLNDLVEGS